MALSAVDCRSMRRVYHSTLDNRVAERRAMMWLDFAGRTAIARLENPSTHSELFAGHLVNPSMSVWNNFLQ
jgi:hypothetical protein